MRSRKLVEYIYNGEHSFELKEDELLEVLRLSHYWGVLELNEKVQDRLIEFVSLQSFASREWMCIFQLCMPDTDNQLYTVREEGKNLGLSNRLAEYCQRFETQNSENIADLAQY
jgi:hypothetical protein